MEQLEDLIKELETLVSKAMVKLEHGVTWRDYVDSQLVALAKTGSASERAIEARLEKLNELHKIVESIQSQSLPRSEYAVAHDSLGQRVSDMTVAITQLRESAAELRGKASTVQVYIAGLVAIVSIITSSAGVAIALLK